MNLGPRASERATPSWIGLSNGASGSLTPLTAVEQLEASTRAFEVELSRDALARLDGIWPGPGGEAPEAYAW